MSTEVKLPELGENVSSGDLVKLLVKPGDHVEKDQPLLELETDKATVEVPSPSTGTVKEVHVREGQTLKVGQAILSLDGENGSQRPQKKEGEAAKIEAPKRAGERPPESAIAAKSVEPPKVAEETRRPTQGRGEPRQITLPELGENVSAGDLVRVLVKVGDQIQKDQAIIELETDKATVEVPSPEAGTVQEVLVKAGQKIKVGQPLLTLSGGPSGAAQGKTGEPPADSSAMKMPAEAAEEPGEMPAAASAPSASRQSPAPAQAQRPAANLAVMPSPRKPGGRSPADVAAPPSVRQLAREIGVDITEIEGTGPGGRITFDDVKRHARESRIHAAAGRGPRT